MKHTLILFSALLLLGVGVSHAELPDLDEGIASFGGAVAGDSLYVYGGHIGGVHKHSSQNLSHRFQRLDLNDPKGWEDIGDNVQGLQGLALVPYGEKVCRVGGLDARNETLEQEEDLVSVADVACFDPATQAWTDLPPLPAPRSSHDAAVLGDTLYAAGGWQLRGKDLEPVWHGDMVALDLSSAEPEWKSIPQPFKRRALAVATAAGKVVVCGGLGPESTSLSVDIYDPETAEWSSGPELQVAQGPMRGFGVSAFGVDGQVLLSGGDGVIFSLVPGEDEWKKVGKLETARFFHRLLPHKDRLIFIAGAARGGHLGTAEVVAMDSLQVEAPKIVTVGDAWRWPGYRGAEGDGTSPSMALPVRWSEDDGVSWRAELPGYGQSAPVVWDNQVFVTSVEGDEKEISIISALDAVTGEVRWRRRYEGSQREPNTEMFARAAPTPAVDADRVYVFMETGDVITLDHHGETVWRYSLTAEHGEFKGNHGVASSPVLVEDLVVIQVTHQGPSYFLALDRADGKVRWKADRESGTAWTTPLVVLGARGYEIVSSGAGRVESLDAENGNVLWSKSDVEKNHVPSPTLAGDLLVVASSDPSHNQAIRRTGQGEVETVWRAEGVTSGFGSPAHVGDAVLITNRKGVVTSLALDDGAERWKHKLPESIWATPVVAGEHVYFFTKNGETVVMRPGVEGPEVVSTNSLPTEETVYGVAAVQDAFLVRTGTRLLRIGAPKAPSASPALAQLETEP
ncbi:MAG: PQQ-binding-like beta-propeller repeat protein [Acidobacteriota bacterium]